MVERTHIGALCFCIELPPSSGTALSLHHPISLLSTHTSLRLAPELRLILAAAIHYVLLS